MTRKYGTIEKHQKSKPLAASAAFGVFGEAYLRFIIAER